MSNLASHQNQLTQKLGGREGRGGCLVGVELVGYEVRLAKSKVFFMKPDQFKGDIERDCKSLFAGIPEANHSS